LHKIRQLDLSTNDITSLPDDFSRSFPELEILLLDLNDIKLFPRQLCDLKSLQWLTLPEAIEPLPLEVISQFPKLKELECPVIDFEHTNSHLWPLPSLTHLTGIDLGKWSDNSLMQMCMLLPELQHVQLNRPKDSGLNGQIWEALSHLKHLHTLQCIGFSTEQLPLFSNFAHLKHLEIWFKASQAGSSDRFKVLFENICTIIDLKTLTIEHFPLTTTDITSLKNRQKLTRLTLRACSLNCVPPILKELNSLQELDLSDNNMIDIIPTAIVQGSNLQNLYLESCGLKKFPLSLTHASKLTILNVNGNSIRQIPSSIVELKSLEELHMSKCGLTSLPASISSMNNLKHLDCPGNDIKVFPVQTAQ